MKSPTANRFPATHCRFISDRLPLRYYVVLLVLIFSVLLMISLCFFLFFFIRVSPRLWAPFFVLHSSTGTVFFKDNTAVFNQFERDDVLMLRTNLSMGSWCFFFKEVFFLLFQKMFWRPKRLPNRTDRLSGSTGISSKLTEFNRVWSGFALFYRTLDNTNENPSSIERLQTE